MPFINKGKHIEREIESTRIRVVEDNASEERMRFLKNLLEHNGYEVLVEEVPPKPIPPPALPSDEETGETQDIPEEITIPESTWIIGVTDIIFNPVVAVYQRTLRTLNGYRVTPDYWNQCTDDAEPNYWDLSKKDF